jgi:hypothetical protein
MKRVHVHIDRLVMKGLRSSEQRVISGAIQRELSRVLADPQALQRLSAAGRVDHIHTAVSITGTAKARQIGGAAARVFGRGLRG